MCVPMYRILKLTSNLLGNMDALRAPIALDLANNIITVNQPLVERRCKKKRGEANHPFNKQLNNFIGMIRLIPQFHNNLK